MGVCITGVMKDHSSLEAHLLKVLDLRFVLKARHLYSCILKYHLASGSLSLKCFCHDGLLFFVA